MFILLKGDETMGFYDFPHTKNYYEEVGFIIDKIKELEELINKQILYKLPIASSDTLGGIKADAKRETDTVPVRIDSTGKLFAEKYTLDMATTSTLGGVKADIKQPSDTQPVRIDSSTGKLYTAEPKEPKPYELKQATTSTLGGIKADVKQSVDTQPVRIDTASGKLYTAPGSGGGGEYVLPQANAKELGGIKAEERTMEETQPVHIDNTTGMLYTAKGSYELPIASTTLGGVVGDLKTPAETNPVKIDPQGNMFTKPYELKQADSYTLGGIYATPKSTEDTQEVKIDKETGRLFVKPGSGGGSSYVLPQADEWHLGGIKAKAIDTQTFDPDNFEGYYTEQIQINEDTGFLYSKPQNGGSGMLYNSNFAEGKLDYYRSMEFSDEDPIGTRKKLCDNWYIEKIGNVRKNENQKITNYGTYFSVNTPDGFGSHFQWAIVQDLPANLYNYLGTNRKIWCTLAYKNQLRLPGGKMKLEIIADDTVVASGDIPMDEFQNNLQHFTVTNVNLTNNTIKTQLSYQKKLSVRLTLPDTDKEFHIDIFNMKLEIGTNGNTPYTPPNSIDERLRIQAFDPGLMLYANKTVYVATTGNDSTGDGTEQKPYKTINYALSRIPKNLNGYTAKVNVAEGTYKEDVMISDTIGNIQIFATNVSVNTIYINNCSYVYVKGITVLKQLESSAPVTIHNSSVSIANCIAKTASQANIAIQRSLVDIKNTTTGNATFANIYGVWSLFSVEYSTFTGNSTNIYSQSSIVCIESTTIGQTRKVGGGQIFE